MRKWTPLPPGVHEHSQGTAYIDDNYTPSFGWSVSLRELMEGSPDAQPMEYRLCRLEDAPPCVEMTEKRKIILRHTASLCDEIAAQYGNVWREAAQELRQMLIEIEGGQGDNA